jgi:hypothetical protein
MPISRTKTSFYRRLLLAHFIDNGINTVPKIMDEIEIPRRTAQDSIASLKDLDIICSFKGALKDGEYIIESWGGISKNWVSDNIDSMKSQLGY